MDSFWTGEWTVGAVKMLLSVRKQQEKTQIMKIFKKTVITLGVLGLAAISTPQAVQAQSKNLAETAMGNSNFSTLVAAVKAAGLVSALTGKGHLTVFAPTNAAFDKLPAGTVEMLLKPENKATLVSILKYHILSGAVPAKAAMGLPSGTNVKTLNGEKIIVRTTSGVVVEPGIGAKAKVIAPDVKATNGIIHGIDTVLLPPSVQRAMAQ